MIARGGHHVTPRGNHRQAVFAADEAREVSLEKTGSVPADPKQVQSLREGLLSFAGVIREGPL